MAAIGDGRRTGAGEAAPAAARAPFTGYQKFVVGVLAFLQFTVILDFMILGPLGAILLDQLGVTPKQFGFVVSAYAFSAGLAGIAAASFADRFDRKRLLLVVYAGFVAGTLVCGVALTYEVLLAGRIVTGLFAGVIGSVVMAIVADLFPLAQRGRVMGVVQSAFAASQVLGLPLGLFLANHWNWHAPFRLIVGVCAVVGVGIAWKLRPVREHLAHERPASPVVHLAATLANRRYLRGFAATLLLASGGFMLMPFGSAFTVHNLGLALDQLPLVYLATGLASLAFTPWIGRVADRVGKYSVFWVASVATIVTVLVFTRLGVTPLLAVVTLNILLFASINARMVATQAMISAVPEPRDRGAYMAISSSVAQFSGGVAASVAGWIVVQAPDGRIERYDFLGLVVAAATALTIALMFPIHRMAVARAEEEARLAQTAARTAEAALAANPEAALP